MSLRNKLKSFNWNRSPAGKSQWKCWQNELQDFKDPTIVALALAEGGHKDTVVPVRMNVEA